jgi:succinate-semialdehyde dehydrogenase / glutarate-semialdehyde dehydrogenase
MPFESVNPATGELHLALFARTRPWRLTPCSPPRTRRSANGETIASDERVHLMERCAELLEGEVPVIAQLMTSEMGKTFASAKGEVIKCAAIMRYYARACTGVARARGDQDRWLAKWRALRAPRRPILAIMPWNFPLWQVFRFVAPNLMTGNVVAGEARAECTGVREVHRGTLRSIGFPHRRHDQPVRRGRRRCPRSSPILAWPA